jgi:hypothetical protein
VKRSSLTGTQWHPGAPRFPKLSTIGMVESRIERGDKIETERRSYISSRVLSAAAFAKVVRGHWAIERTFTGASTLPSTRINHACVPATAPRIWPSYATSLSIWFAKSQTNDPSSDAASAPPGTQNICLKYWGRCDVNLDSLPWVRPRRGLFAGRGGLLCFGLAAIQQWRRIIIHASR